MPKLENSKDVKKIFIKIIRKTPHYHKKEIIVKVKENINQEEKVTFAKNLQDTLNKVDNTKEKKQIISLNIPLKVEKTFDKQAQQESDKEKYNLTTSNNNPYSFTHPQSPYSMHSVYNLDKDYQSGAKIFHVSHSQLPYNVLVMYNSNTHTIYISNKLSGKDYNWVLRHESAHAQGIYNEAGADSYASAHSGYALRYFGNSNYFRKLK